MTHNISKIDIAQFGEFLLKSKIAGSGKEKFLVMWVRKFFSRRSQWPDLGWQDQLPLFLRQLVEDDHHETWQVRQADQAVRAYFCNYLPQSDSAHTCPCPNKQRRTSAQNPPYAFFPKTCG